MKKVKKHLFSPAIIMMLIVVITSCDMQHEKKK